MFVFCFVSGLVSGIYPNAHLDITSLVHTFPFIVNSIHYGHMQMEWKMNSFYWTGVAALVPQVRPRLLYFEMHQ